MNESHVTVIESAMTMVPNLYDPCTIFILCQNVIPPFPRLSNAKHAF